MTNRENAYKQAFNTKNEALRRKEAEYEKSIASLEKTNPRYGELCQGISSLGSQVAITALSGSEEAVNSLKEKLSALQAERDEIVKEAGIKPISYDCDLCRDTGRVKGQICECVKKLAKGFALGMLSKELPLENNCFENFDLNFYPAENEGAFPKKRMTGILKLCKEYALNFHPKNSENLLFMGKSGLGKTHLSLSIVNELIRKDFDVLYCSSYNLFSKMENEYFKLNSDDTYNYAVSCDLLVIDDLGGEFATPFVQSLIYNIINTRLLASKPVIISTNLNIDEIEKRYTARVSSRLLGHYNAKLFIGEDIRQIKLTLK